jgi:hypothetical protein
MRNVDHLGNGAKVQSFLTAYEDQPVRGNSGERHNLRYSSATATGSRFNRTIPFGQTVITIVRGR